MRAAAIVPANLSPFPLWTTYTLEWSPLVANAVDTGRLVLPSLAVSDKNDGYMSPSMSSSSSSSPTSNSVSSLSSSSLSSSTSTLQFVFPDLPNVYSVDHRCKFIEMTRPTQRIHTIAACHHSSQASLIDKIKRIQEEDGTWFADNDNRDTELSLTRPAGTSSSSSSSSSGSSTILLVGGNDKGVSPNSLTTVQAADILRTHFDKTESSSSIPPTKIWGVGNPNDPNSLANLQDKVEAGIEGFLTQPLLSSGSMETFCSYHQLLEDIIQRRQEEQRKDGDTYYHRCFSLIAGMALPSTVKNVHFWSKLLDQEEALAKDPRFRSHLAFFSQPYVTPIAWAGREIQDLYVRGPWNMVKAASTYSGFSQPGPFDDERDDDERNINDCNPVEEIMYDNTDGTTTQRRLRQQQEHVPSTTTTTITTKIQHGIHFMPLKNIDTLCDVVRPIWR